MGCGTSKNAAEGVPGKKAPAQPVSTAATPVAKKLDNLKDSAEVPDAQRVIVVQTPAANGAACEGTGGAPAPTEKHDKQQADQQPAERQHRSEPGCVGEPAEQPPTAPATTARDAPGPATPSAVESAPAEEAGRAPSREAAAEASSSADRTSPAERPSASRPGALPPILTRRPSQPNADEAAAAEAPPDASKLQSRFKAIAAEEEEAPPSPQMFAASRSLNRSIGVRRRTSDAEGSTVSEHAAKREAEEERELAGPDPLREQFEREKDNNPLLRRPTAMSARNSEKSMKSIKSKSSKRPSVGFALGEDDDEDVDPDAHLEAERIASITMPDEEPARAVRMAAAGLGLGPAPGPEQRRSSGGGGRGGLRQGSR